MGTVPQRPDRRRWLPALLAVALTMTLVALTFTPARASVGGSAHATAVQARAPQVELDVQATGTISAVQPILDRLTRDPVLAGRQITAAQVGTPEAPAGTEADTVPQQRIPGLVTVEESHACTQRVQDAELSAQARTGQVSVGLLGLDVLRVGPVLAGATTHPTQEPTARAQEPQVEFFGRDVPLPAEEPIEVDEQLSTADALAALETAVPGLQGLVEAIGGVVEAGGGVQVHMGRSAEADPRTGRAGAVGFHAAVHLDLHARVCIPNLSGGCLAEVTIRTDATVLDLVLAETLVERPETMPVVERIDWAVVVPVIALVAVVLFALGLALGRYRRTGYGDRS